MNHHPEYDYHHHYHPTPAPQPTPGIDWDLVMEITPAIFSVCCWIIWGMFLLIPSAFGLHGVDMFSTANNLVFVLMGFVINMAVSTAIRAGHGFRAVFFGLGIFLLSFWF